MDKAREITIEIFADTRQPGRCKSCKAPLVWAVAVESGVQLPFDAGIFAVISSRRDDDSGRVIERADRRTTHWATCPGRALFKT
jgi:hypothetical protein